MCIFNTFSILAYIDVVIMYFCTLLFLFSLEIPLIEAVLSIKTLFRLWFFCYYIQECFIQDKAIFYRTRLFSTVQCYFLQYKSGYFLQYKTGYYIQLRLAIFEYKDAIFYFTWLATVFEQGWLFSTVLGKLSLHCKGFYFLQ